MKSHYDASIIGEHIDIDKREKVYYPFAGFDFTVANLANSVAFFEDKLYRKMHQITLDELLRALREDGKLNPNVVIKFLKTSSLRPRYRCNTPDTTLIFKGGFLNFFNKDDTLNYGAIISFQYNGDNSTSDILIQNAYNEILSINNKPKSGMLNNGIIKIFTK